MCASRNYCWTLNNWTEDDVTFLKSPSAPVKCVWFGREVGDSGTPHLQGYVELTKPMRIAGVKKIGGPWGRAHLEIRRGSRDEAIEYCGKSAPLEVYGNPNGQGSRTDLDRTRNLALTEGMRGVTLVCNRQQIGVAKEFLTYHEEERDWQPEVIWLWGPTGVGKSRWAKEQTEGVDTYWKNSANRWWDGYDGHECVVLDEFRESWWPLTEMLTVLDRYPKRVETKGGMRQLLARKIIVTSAFPPETVYHASEEDANQLVRRVTTVCNVTKSRGVILEPPCDDQLAARVDNVCLADSELGLIDELLTELAQIL